MLIFMQDVCWISLGLLPLLGSFPKNDVLFSPKRRLVFIKTTCRFFKTTCCFLCTFWCEESSERHAIHKPIFWTVKNLYSPLSRARVHAHYRSFYLFAVTSVTLWLIRFCISVCYEFFLCVVWQMGVSSAVNTLEKTMTLGDFFAFIVSKNGCFSTNVFVKPNEQNWACSSYAMARKRRMKANVFVKPNEQNRACSSYAMARKRRMKSNFFFVCDTCDSKKTTSLLEGARIYAREGLK